MMKGQLAPVAAWWGSLKARERQMLLLAGLVVGLYLTFALAVQPAWRTLRAAPAQLDTLDAQLQGMQRMAGEARELRGLPPVNPAQAMAALKAASDRLGDKAKLSVQGERAVLTLTAVGTEQLRAWLAEARSGARARPVEATLTRGPVGYSGNIVVAIGGAP
jgi:general secretion pathway protein M